MISAFYIGVGVAFIAYHITEIIWPYLKKVGFQDAQEDQ